jgi:hypothetical protein
MVMSDLDRLLDPEYLGDLGHRPMEEIRAMRAECTELETGLSYLRRLVQGRLDIVGREQERRRCGAEAPELHDVIGDLPEIFSEQRRPGGLGRLPQSLDPPEPDPALTARLDELAGPSQLADLPKLADADIEALAAQLGELEREVSQYRRQMFDRIDALQGELTERYRTGRASVDSLLADG